MSAVISDQTTSNVAEFFSPGPGERLRAARLSMGYDLARIASELHLTKSVVEALEADDYSEIEARVFVRGYLRNYARIVGMPVDSILRQFDEKWPEDSSHQSMVKPSPRLPADGGPGRGLAAIVTWTLVIGLLLLFLMWWRGYLGDIVPTVAQTDAVEVPADDNGLSFLPPGATERESLFPADAPLADGPGGLRLPALPAADETTDGTDAQTSPATGLAVDGGSMAGAGDSAATTLPTTVSAEPVAESAPAASAPAVVETGPVETGSEPPAPVAVADEIALTFSAPCWVDVRDSERRFKLFGEMPKGARRVLGGTPPYKMVIGNARAVTITINGQPYDLAQHAKGNVARFTLDL
jgi:cytoskeleton protein RodZ